MNKVHVRLDLSWHCDTPLHLGSGVAMAGFLDDFVRRAGDRRAVIPGTSVKGRSRYYATAVFARAFGSALCQRQREKRRGFVADGVQGFCACPLCVIYGVAGLQPGAMHFGDLRAECEPSTAARWNVQLDPKRRTALDGHLAVREVTPEGVSFVGVVEGHLPEVLDWTPREGTQMDYRSLVGLTTLGLLLPMAFGGGKTRGLGHGRMRINASVAISGQPLEPVPQTELMGWCRQWI